jgi:hypothetical protein
LFFIMLITWGNVADFDATAIAVSPEHRDLILGYVHGTIDASAFDGEDGFVTKLARVYLAAHHAAMITSGQLAGGPVKRDKAGALEREYAISDAQGVNALDTTGAGRLYLSLLRSNSGTALGALL